MANKIEVIITIGRVLRNYKYLLLAIGLATAYMAFAIWLPNLHLITKSIHTSDLDVYQKTKVLVGFLGGYKTNFTNASRAITLSLAVLFGISIALTTYYIKNRVTTDKASGASIGGILIGIIGIGCASCGSVIITTIFGLSVSASFLGALPFNGLEFGILGILILSYSIFLTAKKITNPSLCKLV